MCIRSVCLSWFFFLMIRPPPRSTRTDTLFPYTTLFRSPRIIAELGFLQLDEARALQLGVGRRALGQPAEIGREVGIDLVTERRGLALWALLRVHSVGGAALDPRFHRVDLLAIGRPSGRERVCEYAEISVVALSFKQKQIVPNAPQHLYIT